MRLHWILVAALLPLLTGCRDDDNTLTENFVRTEHWDQETLDIAASLPIQQGGRVMPLHSFAGFSMLRMNHKRSVKLPAADGEKREKLGPVGLFLDCLVYPDQARDYKIFVVSNREVLDAIGVDSKKARDRYSYNDLQVGRHKLGELASAASKHEKPSIVDKAYMSLARALQLFESFEAIGSLPQEEFAIPAVRNLANLNGKGTLLDLLGEWEALRESVQAEQPTTEEIGQLEAMSSEITHVLNIYAALPAMFPPDAENDEEVTWLNSSEVLYASLFNSELDTAKNLELVATMASLHEKRDDREAFRAALLELKEGVKAEADRRGEYGKIESEVSFFNANLIMNALVLFIAGSVTAALSWLFNRRKILVHTSVVATLGALICLILAVVWRSYLRGRPPVLNLYDTILFITSVGATCAMVAELINRKRIGRSVAPILGALGMFLALRYEVKDVTIGGDTLGELQAVLRTNFWLATHVTTITAGYAAGLLASLLSVGWIFSRMFGLHGRKGAFYTDLTKMTYGTLCFGLLLSVVGTILGGVWANESWGRFWGWDPKENGALLICLSQLVILHARLGGYIKQHGIHALSVMQGGVIAFSWWHVNELDAGLHSYGKTEGVLFYLYSAYGFCGLMALISGVTWLVERGRQLDTTPKSGSSGGGSSKDHSDWG